MYLTREQAIAELDDDESSARIVDNAPEYPHHSRTTFHLITRYPPGTVGRWPDAMNADDLFTVGRW